MTKYKIQRLASFLFTAGLWTAPDGRVSTASSRRTGTTWTVVQNPTLSLAGDVAATRQIIAQAKHPVVLVGHSYGGVVITEAGNDPKVSKLVYIAAFAPDKGDPVASLIKDPAPGAPVPRSCPRRMAFCSSIRRSSPRHLPPMSSLAKRSSWLTPRFPGAWPRSMARSAIRRGRPIEKRTCPSALSGSFCHAANVGLEVVIPVSYFRVSSGE